MTKNICHVECKNQNVNVSLLWSVIALITAVSYCHSQRIDLWKLIHIFEHSECRCAL